ncbi:MAG: class I SAM-dependent RNA methyltransferase [Saprospiraceae bacterium]
MPSTVFTAITFAGLESVLANELRALGATDVEQLTRAVRFSGDQKLMYRANYELSTALRILQPFASFRTKHENHFYKKVYEIDWQKYLDGQQTFAVAAVTQSKYFTHSKYLALKTKDAIVDQFRERTGRRPSINRVTPDLELHVHISRDNLCTLSINTSGDPLFKRGYRVDTVDAPINEVLAAGMIRLAGWKADCDFIDPMCGSGTFLIEAAQYAYNIAPQRHRKRFGFMNRANFDAELWLEVKREAIARERDFAHQIIGHDKDFQAIRITGRNVMAAGLDGKITTSRKLFEKLEPSADGGLVMMNPPYDERLGVKDINAFYEMLGDRMKQHFAGYRVWLISSNKEAIKHVGLRPSKKKTLYNGALECKFLEYEMYAGSRRAPKA